ncbi:MAG: DNA repair protein RecO [bacterium]|nr:DNA repair protein RecO [bacterium]
MALTKTDAILLKKFNWSESSRTAVFFSRNYGKIALFDKGGRSFKSKRGRILPFSSLVITYYASNKESRGYISDIDITRSLSFDKEGTLGRLAYGSAACELLHSMLGEEEPNGNLYQYFWDFLVLVDTADKRSLPALFMAFFLRTMSLLGYHPNLEFCTVCSRKLAAELQPDQDENHALEQPDCQLSAQRGGLVCSPCQSVGDHYIPIQPESLRLLRALQSASLKEAATLPIGYSQAAILLDVLERLLKHSSDLGSRLKSLEFLEKLKNSNSMG